MPEVKVIITLKKAQNGLAHFTIQCVADVEGFKGADSSYALSIDDTLTVQIPVEQPPARGVEYIVGQWMTV